MKLLIVAVGQRVPDWAQTACNDYAKRLPPELKLELRAVRPDPRAGKTLASLLAAERGRIEAALPRGAHVVALDERGTRLTTLALPEQQCGRQDGGEPSCGRARAYRGDHPARRAGGGAGRARHPSAHPGLGRTAAGLAIGRRHGGAARRRARRAGPGLAPGRARAHPPVGPDPAPRSGACAAHRADLPRLVAPCRAPVPSRMTAALTGAPSAPV